jgi:hypothetical protein
MPLTLSGINPKFIITREKRFLANSPPMADCPKTYIKKET